MSDQLLVIGNFLMDVGSFLTKYITIPIIVVAMIIISLDAMRKGKGK